ncbi:hypothetical protein C8Q77DRAFT_397014 [Trametes polyzona]|nr:hypothetical protein C8Q77DRAFT_397014 [Trametes polyzona]
MRERPQEYAQELGGEVEMCSRRCTISGAAATARDRDPARVIALPAIDIDSFLHPRPLLHPGSETLPLHNLVLRTYTPAKILHATNGLRRAYHSRCTIAQTPPLLRYASRAAARGATRRDGGRCASKKAAATVQRLTAERSAHTDLRTPHAALRMASRDPRISRLVLGDRKSVDARPSSRRRNPLSTLGSATLLAIAVSPFTQNGRHRPMDGPPGPLVELDQIVCVLLRVAERQSPPGRLSRWESSLWTPRAPYRLHIRA